jgi:uncharacterized protein (UPF0147 family)
VVPCSWQNQLRSGPFYLAGDKISPTSRTKIVRAVREIESQVRPRHRIRVLAELGALRPEEATPLLQRMAHDRTMPPAARLSAATELADLRQDHYEIAATVARELMHDDRVPWHIRRIAACHLAGWSALCRQEARDMIRHIDAQHW